MFRFRLQRVLDLRARTERDAATALVSAQERVDEARAEQERLEAARAQLADTSASAGANVVASIGELRTLHFLLDRLDERVATASHVTTTAEHEAAKKQDELRAAYRERRTLDRLRERHQESWRAAETAEDRRQMDEIALSRYARPGTGANGNADAPADASANAGTPTRHES